jgi:dipeptide/tripeptide permease
LFYAFVDEFLIANNTNFNCYLKAPESMKSVVQAAWLMTVGFGNLIVILVVGGVKALNQVRLG